VDISKEQGMAALQDASYMHNQNMLPSLAGSVSETKRNAQFVLIERFK